MEHIERAGVHSGDSMAVYPPRHLDAERDARRSSTTRERIVLGPRGASGLINIQYVVCAADGASRTSTSSRSTRAPAAPCRSSPR